MSRRPATAHGHLKLSETARQIPGYLVFLTNWANVVEIVFRRLVGTKPPARTRLPPALWVTQSLPSVRFKGICLLRTPAFHAMLGMGKLALLGFQTG